jgi:predicted metalloprotease with PDZ domain
LDGDYDWFFEGFTLYQALRTALQLDLITFSDYLTTIARVFDSYLAAPDRDRLSLTEASERRWTSASSIIYAKGMLIAFIYDLTLRKASNCQASFDDVYRELFREAATGQESANEIIIKILSERAGLESFAKDYVETPAKIDLHSAVSPYGIELQQGEPGVKTTRLTISRNLTKVQKGLLRCIGNRD